MESPPEMKCQLCRGRKVRIMQEVPTQGWTNSTVSPLSSHQQISTDQRLLVHKRTPVHGGQEETEGGGRLLQISR